MDGGALMDGGVELEVCRLRPPAARSRARVKTFLRTLRRVFYYLKK